METDTQQDDPNGQPLLSSDKGPGTSTAPAANKAPAPGPAPAARLPKLDMNDPFPDALVAVMNLCPRQGEAGWTAELNQALTARPPKLEWPRKVWNRAAWLKLSHGVQSRFWRALKKMAAQLRALEPAAEMELALAGAAKEVGTIARATSTANVANGWLAAKADNKEPIEREQAQAAAGRVAGGEAQPGVATLANELSAAHANEVDSNAANTAGLMDKQEQELLIIEDEQV
jgi:hypothetical protein